MLTRVRDFLVDDSGSATVESAIIVIVMAALAGTFFLVATSDTVREGLEGLVQKAFASTP